MKKLIALFTCLILFSALLHAQLSVKEKRQMERLYNSGIEQLKAKQYVDAISAFNQCLVFDETNADAYLQRGRAKAAMGQYSEALTDLDRALQYAPELGEAYFYKGYFMFDADTSGESEKMFQLSLDKGFEIGRAHV